MDDIYDILIIGAGPAGLQLGYYFKNADCRYLILEASQQVGSFFKKYPRNRSLISFNKIYSIYDDPEIKLRWDWNSLLTDDYSHLFKDYSRALYPSADELINYLSDFNKKFKLNIQFGTKVITVRKDNDGIFELVDQSGQVYRAKALVVATGVSKPHIPDIPGIECVTDAYENVTMETNEFINQRVLIIGKGNSSFEIADHLLDVTALIHIASPDPVELAWNSRFSGHVRPHYARILDTYQLKLLNATLDCAIKNIRKEQNKFIVQVAYSHADGEVEELVYDRVIRCTGFKFNTDIFDQSCPVDTVFSGKLPAMTSAWRAKHVERLYFAGVLTQVRDFEQSSSAFIDGYRYNARTLFHFIQHELFNKPLPHRQFDANVELLFKEAITRISRSSALWTQFFYLCDLIVVDEEQGIASYYEELPVDYVADSAFGKLPHYYLITYEWGQWHGDVFAIDRHPQNEQAHKSVFLHPIVRRYERNKLVKELHLVEDLFGTYCRKYETGMVHNKINRTVKDYHYQEHEKPLYDFFAEQLTKAQKLQAAELTTA